MPRPKKYEDKFKSSLERSLASSCLSEYVYEPPGSTISYTVPHTYHPDFIHPNSPHILIEAKGWMVKGQADIAKYLSIVRDNPHKELVFLFSNPNKKAYSGCRTRADGSFMTLGDWCFKSKILYFTEDTFPQELREGLWSLEDIRDYKSSVYGADIWLNLTK